MTAPADRLRQAAALLRQRNEAATPSPWTADTDTRGDCVLWGPNGTFVANAQSEPHWLPAPDGGERAVMFDVDRRDVALIETLRSIAPLIADWLDATADWTDVLGVNLESVLVSNVPGYRRAMALADALLATAATKEH